MSITGKVSYNAQNITNTDVIQQTYQDIITELHLVETTVNVNTGDIVQNESDI
jgi:hypothetical protein